MPSNTYVNPARDANVTWGRIDQGVDGHINGGYFNAICDCVITDIDYQAWQPYGTYIEYRITQPGPLHGMYVYYAEGVKPMVARGNYYLAGSKICSLIPNWHYGFEIGWAAGHGAESWARAYGGGYKEQWTTQAGISFNRLIKLLGAPGGYIQANVMGVAPRLSYHGIRPGRGVSPPKPITIGGGEPPVSDYDPGELIRNAWWQFGVHGARAFANTNWARDYLNGIKYISTKGPH